MTELVRYCNDWDLTKAKKIAETFSSCIYRVCYQEKDAILKILTPAGQKYEARGAAAIRCFNGSGSVRLLKSDDGAHLLEFLKGRHLKDLVVKGDDENATEVICDVLIRLHAYNGPRPNDTISMNEHFRALFSKAQSETADSMYAVGTKLARKLIETENEPCLLHGDIHHKNILESADRGWLTIDPQPLFGERTYDVANSFFNPDDMPALVETTERIQACSRIFSKRLNMDRQRILEFAFAYGCLSSAWCIEDRQGSKSTNSDHRAHQENSKVNATPISNEFRYTLDLREGNTKVLNAYQGHRVIAVFKFDQGCSICDCSPEYCSCSTPNFKLQIRSSGIQVLPDFQKREIGSTIYRLAEIHFKMRIMPDGKASASGKSFRNKFEAKYGKWENDFQPHIEDSSLPSLELVPKNTGNWDLKP